MGWVTVAALFVLGLLGAANLVIAKKPEAKELIAKIAPYQGWIGLICALWGVWWVINMVLNLGWLSTMPIAWATGLVDGLLMAGLGAIFGVGTAKMWVKGPAAAKLDETVAKLLPWQSKLGLVALAMAVWTLCYTLFLAKMLGM